MIVIKYCAWQIVNSADIVGRVKSRRLVIRSSREVAYTIITDS